MKSLIGFTPPCRGELKPDVDTLLLALLSHIQYDEWVPVCGLSSQLLVGQFRVSDKWKWEVKDHLTVFALLHHDFCVLPILNCLV